MQDWFCYAGSSSHQQNRFQKQGENRMAPAKKAFTKLKQLPGNSISNRSFRSIRSPRWFHIRLASALVVAGWTIASAAPMPQTAGANVRVTVDNGSNGSYVSADQLAGGTYADAVLKRCGTDRRMQNEPTLAIDPRNANIWASGANEYCTVPTAG